MKTKNLQKTVSTLLISSLLFWQALAAPGGCIIWESNIWECEIWYSASNVVDNSSEASDYEYGPSAVSWSVTFEAWVNDISFLTTQAITFAAWLINSSSTETTVWAVDIQTALNSLRSWWFAWDTMSWFTMHSWVWWGNMTLTTWTWEDERSSIIPDNTRMFAAPWWSWRFQPSSRKIWVVRAWYTTIDALEVWDASEAILFDKAIKLTELDWTTWTAAYSTDGWTTWTDMATQCTWADDASNIVFPGECYYKDEWANKTYIWTFHATEYWLFVPTWWWGSWTWGYVDTTASIDIEKWVMDIWAPASLTFPTKTILSTSQVSTVANDYVDYFWVEDLSWEANWYDTAIQVSNLTEWAKTIASSNITMTVVSWLTLMAWNTNTDVVIPSAASTWYQNFSTWWGEKVIIERNDDSDWILSKYWAKPTIKVNIPAYQSVWTYTGLITYSLYEY